MGLRRFGAALLAAFLVIAVPQQRARAADAHHYSFGYDQPHTTGHGIVGDIFAAKLAELSHGTMLIDQFPGAQLGQEPQMLQKIRTGDIDFMISSAANAATVSPESGVLSIHFLFRSEDHLIRAIASPELVAAVREMFDATVKDAHVLTLTTLGLRNTAGTTFHPPSTCMMGERPTAVVDTALRVHGMTGLRAIDGSVMPTVVSGNTNATSIMIGEKAADFILRAA